MPNQRKKDKKQVSVWLDEAERANLREAAERLGVSMTDLIKMAVEQEILKSKGVQK